MKLNEAFDLLESLLSKTVKKSEINIYTSFIAILTDLKNRNLSPEELDSIEKELDHLKPAINSGNKKKDIRKVLNSFKKFLKEKLSLITEGYYTAIGMGLGMSFGVAIGTAINVPIGLTMGISIGMVLGMVIGKNMDLKAEKENRVIKTKTK
ncbi:MAG: hypothetical protein DRJ07_03805 [Bacteroidetes bacterium]|nr:MAG: hypothetical protein DRJ07_03805 [Bacteroidota bacterium]